MRKARRTTPARLNECQRGLVCIVDLLPVIVCEIPEPATMWIATVDVFNRQPATTPSGPGAVDFCKHPLVKLLEDGRFVLREHDI